jgi:hypothetical protein
VGARHCGRRRRQHCRAAAAAAGLAAAATRLDQVFFHAASRGDQHVHHAVLHQVAQAFAHARGDEVGSKAHENLRKE